MEYRMRNEEGFFPTKEDQINMNTFHLYCREKIFFPTTKKYENIIKQMEKQELKQINEWENYFIQKIKEDSGI